MNNISKFEEVVKWHINFKGYTNAATIQIALILRYGIRDIKLDVIERDLIIMKELNKIEVYDNSSHYARYSFLPTFITQADLKLLIKSIKEEYVIIEYKELYFSEKGLEKYFIDKKGLFISEKGNLDINLNNIKFLIYKNKKYVTNT